MTVRRLACVAGVLLAGCGSVLDAHRSFVARSSDARVALHGRLIDGNLRILAPATVDGARVTLAIDTGALTHLLTRTQARTRGVESGLASSESVLANGERVNESNSVPVIVSLFAHGRASPQRAIVRENPAFDAAGVAGFAALLSIDEDRSIELDLSRMTMLSLAPPAADRARAELTRLGATLEDWSGTTARPVRTVLAAVEGHSTRLIVDTGSPSSFVFADTAAGADASMRTRAHVSIAWPPTDIAIVDGATLTVAGATFTLPRFTVHPRMDDGLEGVGGILGLDVLQRCAALFDPRGGGAIACESSRQHRDTAPGIDALLPIPSAPPLASAAEPLPAGELARLGCERVLERDIEPWARERGFPVERARAPMLRARVFDHVLAAWGIQRQSIATPLRIEQALAQLRAEHGLLDPSSLDASLRAAGLTEANVRATLADNVIASFLISRLVGLDPRLDRTQLESSVDTLVERMRDRLARVVLERREGRCHERWPSFWIEQIRWSGLDARQQLAVRREVAKVLRGGRLVLDALEVVPSSIRAAVARGCAACGAEPSLVPREEGSFVRITVTRPSARAR